MKDAGEDLLHASVTRPTRLLPSLLSANLMVPFAFLAIFVSITAPPSLGPCPTEER
jgi:hypothetical protein